ncbi:MAG: trypsin-like peptidase domain-containing protein [Pseudomonadales bacterium]|nr:trypsin-like peptidase domain-containing protein [Pseudomonadales bacterium]
MNSSIRYFAIPTIIGLIVGLGVILLQPNSVSIFDHPESVSGTDIAGNSVANTALGSAQRGIVSYSDAIGMATPAVVNIYTQKTITRKQIPLLNDPFFRQFFGSGALPQKKSTQSSLGSGVIVSEQGYILTNYHVIKEADDIVVMLQDGRNSNATLIGADIESDLAVLKINLDGLTTIKLAREHRVEVGDVVFAIGNPFGVGQTVTMGIISATGRAGLGLNQFENFIQTDAAINPGNSGGALIDANGTLIGINTAIFSHSGGSQGIGFAIPSDYARDILLALVNEGHVTRGWLGIDAREILVNQTTTEGIIPRNCILIERVQRNSPAHQAGLTAGDIIVSLNGNFINNGRDAVEQITKSTPGQRLDIGVIRNGIEEHCEVTIAARPSVTQ